MATTNNSATTGPCTDLYRQILDLAHDLHGHDRADAHTVRALTFLLTSLVRPTELICWEVTIRDGHLVIPADASDVGVVARTVPLSQAALAVLDGSEGRLLELLGGSVDGASRLLLTLGSQLAEAAPEGIDGLEQLWANSVNVLVSSRTSRNGRAAALAYAGLLPNSLSRTPQESAPPSAADLDQIARFVDELVDACGFSFAESSTANQRA